MREIEGKILAVNSNLVANQLEQLGAQKILDAITLMDGYDLSFPSPLRPLGEEQNNLLLSPIVKKVFEITEGGKFSLKEKQAYLRLRTEGERREMILKQLISAGKVKEEMELSIELEDNDQMNQAAELLTALGLTRVVHQEKKRISYKLGSVRFDIDTWPSVPTYLEIEGENEESIVQGAKMVGLDPNMITSLSAREVFEMYHVDPTNLVFNNGSNNEK